MESRLYTIADYATLKPWWQGRWGDAPPITALPQSGIIIERDGIDLAAGWLYLDMTTSVSFAAWLVANPDNSPPLSKEAVVAVVRGLEEIARSQGRTIIITCLPSGSLSNLLQDEGFQKTDSGMEHLTKEIK